MKEDSTKPLSNVIRIDDDRIQDHLGKIVRGSVEETLNALLDAEADRLCNAERYERTEALRDTRAGSYERKLHTKVREVAHMLKAIHAQEDRAAARAKADEVIAKLKGMRLSKAAQLVEETVDETVVYYAFPDEHWRRIRTNTPLERLMREIRRRTRAVGAFPDGESALNLAAARLRHIAGTKWSAKRYLNMKLLKEKTMIA